MSYVYVSPITGYIPQDVYYLLAKRYDMDKYLKEYASIVGRRRIVIPAILDVEYETRKRDSEIWTGAEIYNYLTSAGYTNSTSIAVMKLFAASADTIERLRDRDYGDDYILYTMTYLQRLHELGISIDGGGISYRPSYAMGMDIYVSPILVEHVPDEPPPPPPPIEYEEWRQFQISMLIDCTTRDIHGKESKRKIELRGIFKAEKDMIIDWNLLGNLRDVIESMLRGAGVAAERIIKQYAVIKGYGDLMEYCQSAEFYGCNLLESIDSEFIDEDDVLGFATDALLEVVDVDFNRVPFSDKVVFIGRWWEDKSYYESELNAQVTS